MFASGINDIETMKILIEAGADIEHKNKDGERALEFAVRKEQKEAADYLKLFLNNFLFFDMLI